MSSGRFGSSNFSVMISVTTSRSGLELEPTHEFKPSTHTRLITPELTSTRSHASDDFFEVAREKVQDWHRANIESILGAYRSRQLKLVNDMTSVWYAGNLVAGPMSRKNLDTRSIYVCYSEWNKEYGPGLIWIEKGGAYSTAAVPWIRTNIFKTIPVMLLHSLIWLLFLLATHTRITRLVKSYLLCSLLIFMALNISLLLLFA